MVRSYRYVIVVTNIVTLKQGEPIKHRVESFTKIQKKTFLNNVK